jgi:hypothetical protein
LSDYNPFRRTSITEEEIMAGPVKIKVNLSAGTIKIEADAENIDAVFDRLDSFVPRLSEAYERSTKEGVKKRQDTPIGPSSASEVSPLVETRQTHPIEQKTESRKGSKGTKGKEVYTTVDLGLTEAQRTELRDFYALKQPKSQNEQVAVLMDWLKREGNKATVTWNDIFTAFRTVSVKSPAKISSVLGNMVGLSWIRNVGAGQYEIIHVGEDHVKFDLPKSNNGDKA